MLASVAAWLHIAAVVVAIGGSAFALLILRPLAMRTLEPPAAMALMGAVQARFRWAIWGGIVVLILTGLWTSYSFRGVDNLEALTSTSFGRTLAVKSALSLLLFGVALSITLPWARLDWFRQRQVTFMRLNLALATVIVLLAALLVRRGGIF